MKNKTQKRINDFTKLNMMNATFVMVAMDEDEYVKQILKNKQELLETQKSPELWISIVSVVVFIVLSLILMVGLGTACNKKPE